MNIHLNFSRARVAGYTLVEIYMATAILLILVIAITATQLFAARVYTLAATKLTATAGGRKAMNDLRDAVKSSVGVQVGIYDTSANTFSLINAGQNLIGNALAIYPNIPANTNALNYATIYFMNQQASNMCSVIYSNDPVAGKIVVPSTLANNIVVWITNYYVFDAEDSHNTIQKNYTADRIIHIKFLFSQWEYPLAGVGGGAMYDYYQLQTRAAMRMPTY